MKSKRFLFSLASTFILLVSLCFAQEAEIRYVALGDSYVIGTGASPEESWPAVLTRHLRKEGRNITLVANLGSAGWTTQDVINHQLPLFQLLNPSFATLQIGVNDWVRGVDAETFRSNIITIFESVRDGLPQKKNFAVVTIPDFSTTPNGPKYSGGRDIAAGIARFNAIIIEEAKRREIIVIDIYEFSKTVGANPSLISGDGLHPSSIGYAYWEKLIYSKVNEIF